MSWGPISCTYQKGIQMKFDEPAHERIACPVCGREFATTVLGRVPEHGETSHDGTQLPCSGGVIPTSLAQRL